MKNITRIGVAALFLLALGIFAPPVEAATVGGAVLDAAGNPVAGALVTIQQVDVPRGQRAFAARVTSDRGGRFVFDGIPGGYYVVAAQTRTSAVRTRIGVRENGAVRVQLVLPRQRVRMEAER